MDDPVLTRAPLSCRGGPPRIHWARCRRPRRRRIQTPASSRRIAPSPPALAAPPVKSVFSSRTFITVARRSGADGNPMLPLRERTIRDPRALGKGSSRTKDWPALGGDDPRGSRTSGWLRRADRKTLGIRTAGPFGNGCGETCWRGFGRTGATCHGGEAGTRIEFGSRRSCSSRPALRP